MAGIYPYLSNLSTEQFSRILTDELLTQVERPGQYLGNEWGAVHKDFDKATVRLALAFPDLYELGMSNFGQRILYNIVNREEDFLCDRTYCPNSDLQSLLRDQKLPLWGFESRKELGAFELIGFSLAYELTYTNVLSMLDMAQMPVIASERNGIFPLVFGGGPATVNPEPMAEFLDFFVIGDGEAAIPAIMERIKIFKENLLTNKLTKHDLLVDLAATVAGVYVPSLYEHTDGPVAKPIKDLEIPERVHRQIYPLNDSNQPTEGPISYLNLVHDRQVLEVRRGCDRGCRFCQPGYTFLPVRERSADDLLRLSKESLQKSGHQEYSMLSLCVSDYTALHEAVSTLNREHSQKRASLSFPSQRADRMNLDVAEELKVVRKSGITLAPEAGTERLRAVINKGLSHDQIISAIESAYSSGWSSVKLYFMLGLPTETDEDLFGILEILKEASERCRVIRNTDRVKYRRGIEFTCTMSNFVPKPFTPFQWFAQITRQETTRRHTVMRQKIKEMGLRNVTLNFTMPETSLLESVISRGDRKVGKLIHQAWRNGAHFDAWDDRFKPQLWHDAAREIGVNLEDLACIGREVGSKQPWDVIHIGLSDWWLVKEWEKALAVKETAPCTENTCHACGVCTELDTTHLLAAPRPEQLKKNPFVKELAVYKHEDDSHPSLFFMKPEEQKNYATKTKIRFELKKIGDLKFVGHLDLQHALVRAIRRAQIEIAHTEGFNPSPKLALASALPLLQESLAEVAEIELSELIAADEFMQRVNSMLPLELRIVRARVVALRSPSLATSLNGASYKVVANGQLTQEEVLRAKTLIDELMQKSKLEVQKTTKSGVEQLTDIKPGIFALKVVQESELTLELNLATGSKMHVKPTDVLNLIEACLNRPKVIWSITRTGMFASGGVSLFDLDDGLAVSQESGKTFATADKS